VPRGRPRSLEWGLVVWIDRVNRSGRSSQNSTLQQTAVPWSFLLNIEASYTGLRMKIIVVMLIQLHLYLYIKFYEA